MKNTIGVARTNKLYCSNCKKDIKKGSLVLFYFKNRRFKNCECNKCAEVWSEIDDMHEETLHWDAYEDAMYGEDWGG